MTPPSPWSSAGSGQDHLDTGDNIPQSLVAGRLKLCVCLSPRRGPFHRPLSVPELG